MKDHDVLLYGDRASPASASAPVAYATRTARAATLRAGLLRGHVETCRIGVLVDTATAATARRAGGPGYLVSG